LQVIEDNVPEEYCLEYQKVATLLQYNDCIWEPTKNFLELSKDGKIHLITALNYAHTSCKNFREKGKKIGRLQEVNHDRAARALPKLLQNHMNKVPTTKIQDWTQEEWSRMTYLVHVTIFSNLSTRSGRNRNKQTSQTNSIDNENQQSKAKRKLDELVENDNKEEIKKLQQNKKRLHKSKKEAKQMESDDKGEDQNQGEGNNKKATKDKIENMMQILPAQSTIQKPAVLPEQPPAWALDLLQRVNFLVNEVREIKLLANEIREIKQRLEKQQETFHLDDFPVEFNVHQDEPLPEILFESEEESNEAKSKKLFGKTTNYSDDDRIQTLDNFCEVQPPHMKKADKKSISERPEQDGKKRKKIKVNERQIASNNEREVLAVSPNEKDSIVKTKKVKKVTKKRQLESQEESDEDSVEQQEKKRKKFTRSMLNDKRSSAPVIEIDTPSPVARKRPSQAGKFTLISDEAVKDAWDMFAAFWLKGIRGNKAMESELVKKCEKKGLDQSMAKRCRCIWKVNQSYRQSVRALDSLIEHYEKQLDVEEDETKTKAFEDLLCILEEKRDKHQSKC